MRPLKYGYAPHPLNALVGYYDWLKYPEIADGPTTSAVSQTVTWTERIPGKGQ
ncbi:hypothetical protein [Streptomyces sp. NPDC059134]|uniref:hypothetical protein n=1 Tax=Streptomyces sp. NPDC059134 TaxID=3346738 RepID=UPI00368305D5